MPIKHDYLLGESEEGEGEAEEGGEASQEEEGKTNKHLRILNKKFELIR